MNYRKKSSLNFKFVLFSACCSIAVISAAAFGQATFRSSESQVAQSVFDEQSIGSAVDLTDAIAVQEQEEAKKQAEEKAAAEQANQPQTINGYAVHDELPIVQPTLTPEQAQNISITVNKSEHTLTLYSGDTAIAQYSVGLGSVSGAKEKQNDKRTPEGEYYICVLNAESRFHLSLGLSYPNISDADRGLSTGLITKEEHHDIVSAINAGQTPDWYTNLGGQIMIHGQMNDLGGQADWTAGCVAVNNQVMDLIWNYCQVGTKVTILP